MYCKTLLLAFVIYVAAGAINTAAAAEYTHPGKVYSFEYPGGWKSGRDETSGVILVGPEKEEGRVVCHSMANESPSSAGGSVEKMIGRILDEEVGLKAIRAADPRAVNIKAAKFKTADGVAQQTLYDTTVTEDGKDAFRRVSQVLTYNTVTGHTVDITCIAPVGAWVASYGGMFEKIQKSLKTVSLGGSAAAPPAGEPDFLRGKEENVREAMKLARANITKARLSDGSYISPETKADLEKPLIPYEDARRVVNRGILTALAEHCGLDWRNKSYLPLMVEIRAQKKWSDKQLAYIGLLHGMTQGSFLNTFAGQGGCDEGLKGKVEGMLARIE